VSVNSVAILLFWKLGFWLYLFVENMLLPVSPRLLLVSALISIVAPLRAADGPPVVAKAAVNAPVTVSATATSWVLANGIVKATINKGNGNMTSLIFQGVETMGGGGYWEETPQGAPQLTQTVTIDPAKNGGARAEVAVKGVTGGRVMLTPSAPGAERIATLRFVTRWAAAKAAFTPMRFSRTRPLTGRWA